MSAGYYWTDPAYASVQFTEQTASLIVDLVDGASKSLAWRLYIHHSYGGPSDPRTGCATRLDKGVREVPAVGLGARQEGEEDREGIGR